MSLFGPPDIEKLMSKKDINGLIKALGYKNYPIRCQAANALGKLGDTRAVIPLLPLLKDGGTSCNAATALGNIGDPRAIEPLKTALHCIVNNDLRKKAAHALAAIGGDQARGILVSELFDKDKAIKEYISSNYPGSNPADIFSLLELENVEDIRKDIGAILESSGWKLDNTEVCAILESSEWKPPDNTGVHAMWKSDNTDVCAVLDASGWIPDNTEAGAQYWIFKEEYEKCVEIGQPAVLALIRELKMRCVEYETWVGPVSNSHVSSRAFDTYEGTCAKKLERIVEALSRIGSPAIQPLVQLFRDVTKINESWASRYARSAFSQIRDEQAGEILLTLLEDDDPELRKDSACILGKLKDTRAVKPLISMMKDKNDDARHAAIIALGEIKDTRAIEPLISMMKDKNDDIRHAAMLALNRIGNIQAFDTFIQALNDNYIYVRANAVDALGKLHDDRAILPLCEKLFDEEKFVRSHVAEALKKHWGIDSEEAIMTLEKTGWKPKKDEIGVRYWILKGDYDQCAALGDVAIEILISELLSEKDHHDEIFKALERFGDNVVGEARDRLKQQRERNSQMTIHHHEVPEPDESYDHWIRNWGLNE